MIIILLLLLTGLVTFLFIVNLSLFGFVYWSTIGVFVCLVLEIIILISYSTYKIVDKIEDKKHHEKLKKLYSNIGVNS